MTRKNSLGPTASFALIILLSLALLAANHAAVSLLICIGAAAVWLVFYFWNHKRRLPTYDMSEIDQMSGHEFEEFVCSLFQSLGYRAQVTQKSRDFGVDVICEQGRDKIAVQTKRYSRKVNLRCVQEVTAGMRKYNCNKSMVVTNSYFFESAIELAIHNECVLIDRDKLILLIHKSAKISA